MFWFFAFSGCSILIIIIIIVRFRCSVDGKSVLLLLFIYSTASVISRVQDVYHSTKTSAARYYKPNRPLILLNSQHLIESYYFAIPNISAGSQFIFIFHTWISLDFSLRVVNRLIIYSTTRLPRRTTVEYKSLCI